MTFQGVSCSLPTIGRFRTKSRHARPVPPRGFFVARRAERGQTAAMRKLTKFVTLPLFGLTAAIVAIGMSVDAPEAERAQDPTAGPRYACGHFIEQTLNNPDSFDPVNRLGWPTNFRDDGIITVAATYRATNAFGAVVTETTYCDITEADGEYRLQEFRQ